MLVSLLVLESIFTMLVTQTDPASTLNPQPYTFHLLARPLPVDSLSSEIKNRIVTYQGMNHQIFNYGSALKNFKEKNEMRFNLHAQGNIEFGVVAAASGSMHFWWWHYGASAGVMAGAMLQLTIDVMIVQTLWALSGQTGSPSVSACVRFVFGLIAGAYFNNNGHVSIAHAFYNIYTKQWGNNCLYMPSFDSSAQQTIVENVITSAV